MAEITTEMSTLLNLIADVRNGDMTANDLVSDLESLKSDIELEWSNLEDEKEKLQDKYDELEDKINNLI